MKRRIRYMLIYSSEHVCDRIDRLPEWTWYVPGLHRLGCPRGLALWSINKDEVWRTGYWKDETE